MRNEYKYPAILYGYLDSWLFCTVKNLFGRLAALMFIVTVVIPVQTGCKPYREDTM